MKRKGRKLKKKSRGCDCYYCTGTTRMNLIAFKTMSLNLDEDVAEALNNPLY